MKNESGFTIIELIMAFSISMIVLLLLFQLLINLKNIYNESGIKTELLIKQSTISDKINGELSSKLITGLSDCGIDCIVFEYSDNTSSKMSIDRTNGLFNFGKYSTNIIKGSVFESSSTKYYLNLDNRNNNLDAYMAINIPISHPAYEDTDFGINLVYQYNSSETYLIGVDF